MSEHYLNLYRCGGVPKTIDNDVAFFYFFYFFLKIKKKIGVRGAQDYRQRRGLHRQVLRF
jgi:hypothetical protein